MAGDWDCAAALFAEVLALPSISLAVSLKLLHQKFHESIFIPQFLKSFSQPGQNQTCNAETLIKGAPWLPGRTAPHVWCPAKSHPPDTHSDIYNTAPDNWQNPFAILGVLDILADHIPVSSFFQTLIDQDQLG